MTLFVSSECASSRSSRSSSVRRDVRSSKRAERLIPVLLEHERIDLLLQEPNVRREREHVLDRAVVQVEPEPHEAPLGGADEHALAIGRVLEQLLALDDGAQAGRGFGEERVRDLRFHRAEPADDSRIAARRSGARRRSEGWSPQERKAGTAAEDGLRLCAHAAARLAGATEGEHALEPTGGALPERDLGEDVEPEHEVELRLRRQERRELEKPGTACCLTEEDDSGGGEGEGARLGNSRGGTADVGLVQLEGGCELDHCCRCVEDRRKVVACLAVPAPVADQPRAGKKRA